MTHAPGVRAEQQELLSPHPESHRPRTFLAGVGTLDAGLAADARGCLPLAGSFLRKGAASGAAAAACASSGSCALASAHALRRASLISSIVTFRLPAPGQQAHWARPTHTCIIIQSFTPRCETLMKPEAASKTRRVADRRPAPESILAAASVMEGLAACGSAALPSGLPRLASLPETLPRPRVMRPSSACAELAGSSVRLLAAARALSSIAGVGGSGVGSAWKWAASLQLHLQLVTVACSRQKCPLMLVTASPSPGAVRAGVIWCTWAGIEVMREAVNPA